jgi:hypothetical protein
VSVGEPLIGAKVKKIFIVFLAVLLVACGRQGAEYLGKWQTADGKHTVEISQNGENLLLKVTDPAHKGLFFSEPGKTTTTTISGVVKDGLLKIDGPFGGATVTYVKKSDTLLIPGGMGDIEYKRLK